MKKRNKKIKIKNQGSVTQFFIEKAEKITAYILKHDPSNKMNSLPFLLKMLLEQNKCREFLEYVENRYGTDRLHEVSPKISWNVVYAIRETEGNDSIKTQTALNLAIKHYPKVLYHLVDIAKSQAIQLDNGGRYAEEFGWLWYTNPETYQWLKVYIFICFILLFLFCFTCFYVFLHVFTCFHVFGAVEDTCHGRSCDHCRLEL